MEPYPPFLNDKDLCRDTINRLKSGDPPSNGEMVKYLSVGCEPYLERIHKGLNAAKHGRYDVILVEGGYGKGKSNLIEQVNSIALQQKFMVKRLDVGSDLFFNRPNDIIDCILGSDYPISRKEYSEFNYRYGTLHTGNQFAKFCVGLQILADRCGAGKEGLILLIDELENTFGSENLARFASRANAYKVLDIFFKGGHKWYDNMNIMRSWDFKGIFVVMAITPNTINEARKDSPSSWYFDGDYYNPAEEWELPDFVKLSQLTLDQAYTLAKKIRIIHNIAFNWKSEKYFKDKELLEICQTWSKDPVRNDERALVKQVIDQLEILEQNR